MTAINAQDQQLIDRSLQLGQRGLETGDFDAAWKAFDIVLQLDPTNETAQSGLREANYQTKLTEANIAFETQAYQEAIELYQAAARVDGSRKEPKTGEYLAQGYAAYAANDFVQAATWLRRAVQHAPDNALTTTGLQQALYAAGKSAENRWA